MAWSRAACVFGWGTVDLVGEEEVGEQRALKELELAAAGLGVFLDDVRADDVRGHQVGGELDSPVVHLQGPGDGLGHEGLAQAGNAEQSAMPRQSKAVSNWSRTWSCPTTTCAISRRSWSRAALRRWTAWTSSSDASCGGCIG